MAFAPLHWIGQISMVDKECVFVCVYFSLVCKEWQKNKKRKKNQKSSSKIGRKVCGVNMLWCTRRPGHWFCVFYEISSVSNKLNSKCNTCVCVCCARVCVSDTAYAYLTSWLLHWSSCFAFIFCFYCTNTKLGYLILIYRMQIQRCEVVCFVIKMW